MYKTLNIETSATKPYLRSFSLYPEVDVSKVMDVPCSAVFIVQYSRGLCLNYLKKISQTWWSSVGSILQ